MIGVSTMWRVRRGRVVWGGGRSVKSIGELGKG